MYAQTNSMSIQGIDGMPITVEVDISSGFPEFSMVGDLSAEVREARERVKTSLKNTDYDIPSKRIIINLSPADFHKEGTAYDLAIAIGILAACGDFEETHCEDFLAKTVFLGELGLDGRVCPVPGMLSMAIAARNAGFTTCVVSDENAAEASMIKDIEVIPVSTLQETRNIVKDNSKKRIAVFDKKRETDNCVVDFSEVNGQHMMRRAAEIAAAGMHNILFIGSPGSGKTMIARRIPTILPDLTWEEALEVTQIYSVCGLTSAAQPILKTRPFRTPHHTLSSSSLIGGGRVPRPGEISLADRGVLFLDELTEFNKNVLEALRGPLEDKEVSIIRTNGRRTFPANFMLCAATNPCRCGYYPNREKCNCSETDVKKYLQKISRPLLDRIDITVEAPPVLYSYIKSNEPNESSGDIRKRVESAWRIQQKRFKEAGIYFNSSMQSGDIKKYCILKPSCEKIMEASYEKMNLSARGYHKILKVARTIADLEASDDIEEEHLLEALSFRGIDNKIWS